MRGFHDKVPSYCQSHFVVVGCPVLGAGKDVNWQSPQLAGLQSFHANSGYKLTSNVRVSGSSRVLGWWLVGSGGGWCVLV